MNTSIAFAQGSGSHGGGFVLCVDEQGKAESIEVADIFEQRESSILSYEQLKSIELKDYRFRIMSALKRYMSRKLFQRFQVEWREMVSQSQHDIGGSDPSPDARMETVPSLKLPKNCHYIQGATYRESNRPGKTKVVWTTDWYNEFERLGGAPQSDHSNPYAEATHFMTYDVPKLELKLKVHEAIYALARSLALDWSSERSRLLTAMILSDLALMPESQVFTSEQRNWFDRSLRKEFRGLEKGQPQVLGAPLEMGRVYSPKRYEEVVNKEVNQN